MRRSYVFGRADEMAVRRLNAMAFNELDIVSSLKRTGDPTLGDRHEYRTPTIVWRTAQRNRPVARTGGHGDDSSTCRADLSLKEKALVRLEAPDSKMHRHQAQDSAHRFPQTL